MATKPAKPKEQPVDPDYGIDEGAAVDNTLPEGPPVVDNTLPINIDNALPEPPDGNVDNTLPEGPEVIFPGASVVKTLPPSVATRYKLPQEY